MKKYLAIIIAFYILLLCLTLKEQADAAESVPNIYAGFADHYHYPVIEVPGEEEVKLSDAEMLATLIHFEAGDQNRLCKEYVASACINRLSYWECPDDLKGVIYQKGQYATAKFISSNIYEEEDFDIALDILTNGSKLPEYVIFQHYKNEVSGTSVYCQVGTEVFSYYEEYKDTLAR